MDISGCVLSRNTPGWRCPTPGVPGCHGRGPAAAARPPPPRPSRHRRAVPTCRLCRCPRRPIGGRLPCWTEHVGGTASGSAARHAPRRCARRRGRGSPRHLRARRRRRRKQRLVDGRRHRSPPAPVHGRRHATTRRPRHSRSAAAARALPRTRPIRPTCGRPTARSASPSGCCAAPVGTRGWPALFGRRGAGGM